MIRPSLRLRASMILAAGALATTACSAHHVAATSPSTSPVSATTASQRFNPYDANGAVSAPLNGHSSGSCWTSSIADPSSTTYRCMADNQILDPCFAPPHDAHPGAVACYSDPWSPGTLLNLTDPLPASDPSTRATPWALELANGAHCVVVTGTVDQVGLVDLGYSCGGSAGAGLAGSAGTARTVQYRPTDSQPLHSVAVRTAWH